jgi:hypothetical protein
VVEQKLGMRERLEPRTEARLRLADSLGDGADPTSVERVEVKDAVGLAEPERSEHYGFGLVGPPHADKSRFGVG